MGYLFWLTVLASFVLAGLTIYQAYDKVQSDNDAIREKHIANEERVRADKARQETKVSQDKAEEYLNNLKLANEKIQVLNKEALIKADEIINKNEKVIKAQTETIRSVTGYGVPIAVAGRSNNKDGGFFVLNRGNYNLKNLTVTIYDFTDGLKTHLKDNVMSSKKLEEHLFSTASIVTLAPSVSFIVPGFFDFNDLKAFEIRITTDHGEFREFFICEFDNVNGVIKQYYYKLYEIDRLTLKFHHLEQMPKDNSMDHLFEKYFIMHNYMLEVK